MAWTNAVKSFLGSGAMVSMVGGMIATGSYVVYIDQTRYPRMMATYARGNILPPLAENDHEVSYFKRQDVETEVRRILQPTFQNEYFVVHGPVGCGKTRLFVETIRDLIKRETQTNSGAGAPIFVSVNQGRSFPESLAQAINFYYDEHVSFRFFMDYVMRIHSFPQKDENNRLVRVLDAIEESSFKYIEANAKPVILVIDGADSLIQSMPGALEKIQDKAKLWADTNAVKVVFICNRDETTHILQSNSSNWSRAATPIFIGDITMEEAVAFLTSPILMENTKGEKSDTASSMPLAMAERIYNLVGGRIHHLIVFKRNFRRGTSLDDTSETLMDREREKFVHVSKNPSAWKVITMLRESPDNALLLSKLIKASSESIVDTLVQRNIIRYERTRGGMGVRFESKLTVNVVDDLEKVYQESARSEKTFTQPEEDRTVANR